jgi:hypothetical protein
LRWHHCKTACRVPNGAAAVRIHCERPLLLGCAVTGSKRGMRPVSSGETLPAVLVGYGLNYMWSN